MPVSEAELVEFWSLLERWGWEVNERYLASLSQRGVRQRRLWVDRNIEQTRIVDLIEGEVSILTSGEEAVWATAGTGLDTWLCARKRTAAPGDAAVPAGTPPSLVIAITRDSDADRAISH